MDRTTCPGFPEITTDRTGGEIEYPRNKGSVRIRKLQPIKLVYPEEDKFSIFSRQSSGRSK